MLPDEDLYLPAAQEVHDPAGPVFPAEHKFEQSPTSSLPFGLVLPAGQYAHVAIVVAPTTAENLPSIHVKQVPKEVAPNELEYLPAGQRSHV